MTETRKVGRLIIPSLVLSRVVAQPSSLITGLLLIEIAESMNVPVGVAGQLSTSVSILVVLGSIAMSYLSLKFNHKTLMIIGLTLYCCSYLGSFFAPIFPILLLTFSTLGVARSMVDPMASSYVGSLLPKEKRAQIISLFFAGMAAVVVIGSPFIGVIAESWGWRMPFLVFALPLPIFALILTMSAMPDTKQENVKMDQGEMKNGFKQIIVNRSALACIFSVLLSEATWSISIVYGITFIRQRFTMAPREASFLLIGTSLCFMAGSLTGGRLVNRLGRKTLAVVSTFILGILTMTYFNLGIFLASASVMLLACGVSAMRYTVSESLILEQVPEFRGTVMSLNSIGLGLGAAIGSAVGGYVLLLFGFGGLGFFGLLSLTASLLYQVYSIDPFHASSP